MPEGELASRHGSWWGGSRILSLCLGGTGHSREPVLEGGAPQRGRAQGGGQGWVCVPRSCQHQTTATGARSPSPPAAPPPPAPAVPEGKGAGGGTSGGRQAHGRPKKEKLQARGGCSEPGWKPPTAFIHLEMK